MLISSNTICHICAFTSKPVQIVFAETEKNIFILEAAGMSLTCGSWSSVTLLFLCLLTLWLCLQELEALRGGEAARLRELSAEQRELRCELEAVHSEQSRQLSQARQEQLDLETRLEQLRQQACACEPGAQRQQEARYTEQVQMKVALLSTANAIYSVLIGLYYSSKSSGETVVLTSQIFAWHKRTSEPLVHIFGWPWAAVSPSYLLLKLQFLLASSPWQQSLSACQLAKGVCMHLCDY